MHARQNLRRPRWIALHRLLAVLAVVAQVAMAFSALAEGRDGIGAAPHVEAPGRSATHYAHNEATCTACQARLLHGTAPAMPAPPHALATLATAAIPASIDAPSGPALPANPARAPPCVI